MFSRDSHQLFLLLNQPDITRIDYVELLDLDMSLIFQGQVKNCDLKHDKKTIHIKIV